MPKRLVRSEVIKVLAFLTAPVVTGALLVANGTSGLDIGIFLCVAFINALLFPHLKPPRFQNLFGALDRDHVDFFYYSLGMLGVCLFFLAEGISDNEATLRENNARYTAMLADLAGFSSDPTDLFSQPSVRENLREHYIPEFEQYIADMDANRSECSPSNWDRYDFCNEQKRTYRTAQRFVDSGSFRYSRGRTCCAFSDSTADILRRVSVRVNVPSTYGRQANAVTFDSVMLAEYLFAVPFQIEGSEEQIANFRDALDRRRGRVQSAYDRNLALLNLQTNFGAVSAEQIWAANFWPFILILALSTKIGRDQWFLGTRSVRS